jgi:hypothetical protein
LIKVKLSFPHPHWPLIRQTPAGSGKWNNYQFFINDSAINECDYWVVFNSILSNTEACNCNPGNTIFLACEPASISKYYPRFLNQFSHVITCQREITSPHVTYFHQGQPWFVNKNYDELAMTNEIIKTKQISIITSNKQYTDVHKKRYAFSMSLKEYFGDAIDLFGRGVKDFQDKWDVLAPYRYSIPIENSSFDDYFSEKLYDCYLTHTFPFYYGCPNIKNYFSERSYITIDITNLDASKRVIEGILNDSSHYEKHLPFLIESKKTYLNTYNLFPLIVNFIESNGLNANGPKEKITLHQNFYDPYTLSLRMAHKIQRLFP